MKTENDQLIAKMLELLAAAKKIRKLILYIQPGCTCEDCDAVRHLDEVITQAEGGAQ